MIKRLFLTILFLFSTILLLAQKKINFITYYNDEIGKDTIITRVSFAIDNVFEKQHAISIVNKNGEILKTFKAEEINSYRDDGVEYVSTYLMDNDSVKRLLVPRVYRNNEISIFKYYPNKKESFYYVKIAGDSILKPMVMNNRNLLSDYLLTFPFANDERVKSYIHQMNPTISSFHKRYKVVLTENTNFLTRIRWGILAGMGIGQISNKDYVFNSKIQGLFGIFGDFPFYESLSIHSELAYREYSDVVKITPMGNHFGGDAIYNYKSFMLPLMVRYTTLHLKGKCLPYLQMGIELQYALKKETANQFIVSAGDDYLILDESGIISLNKFSTAITGGIGVEWKWEPSHSIFFDLRYTHEFNDFSLSGIYAVVSFNL